MSRVEKERWPEQISEGATADTAYADRLARNPPPLARRL